MKIRLFLMVAIVATLCQCSVVYAQTISYLHKPFSSGGCYVTYSVSKQDTSYYIIVTVKSDRMFFFSNSTMKIRTFKDEVITLKGSAIGNSSESVDFLVGQTIVPATEINSSAQFVATPEQLKKLKHGIAKVRLSMRPTDHERVFKKDKIGMDLYQLYLEAQKKDEEF